jgi:hypothetical protein
MASAADTALLIGGVAKPTEYVRVPLRVAFYNVGLQKSQLQTEELYGKWVLRNLRRDVLIMINEHEVDVVCLCEIGTIHGNAEEGLRNWMSPGAAKPGSPGAAKPGYLPFVQRMLLELVEKPAEWKAFAFAHYGVLIKSTTVNLVEEPVSVGLHKPHPKRVAMKFKIAPLTGGVEKPATATEVWNIIIP